ncbi:MAG: hypothetical protein HY094_08300 [Candidatus Melainabacteria bacterium]|nr:hypothetical protein [Candidatus Melainabacteria bacterium]
MFSKSKVERFKPVLIIVLSVVLICCLVRSHIRTLDWKDNYSFLGSSYKISKDPLLKAVKLGMLGKAVSIFEPYQKEKSTNYFRESLYSLHKAKTETKKLKLKYQDSLPLVIKSYGLDYDSLLSKIAFVEASLRCLELKEENKVGLTILKPYVKRSRFAEPRILDLYANLLISERKYVEAKKVLLRANSLYPNLPFTLTSLADFTFNHDKDLRKTEMYLLKAFKSHPYDKDILLKLFDLYQKENNSSQIAKYGYLYGLRTHSKSAYLQALVTYLNLRQLNSAKKTISKLLQIAPNDPEALYFISKYYFEIKNYQKALSFLLNSYYQCKKSGVDPLLAFDVSNNLAKLYLFLGNKDAAIKLANEIETFAGNNVEVLLKLAKLYKSLGLTDDLNSCIRKIQSIKTGNRHVQ